MSSWLRRLSRDRSSKVEQDLQMPPRPFTHDIDNSPPQPYKDTQYSSGFNSQDKLQTYRPSTSGDVPPYNAIPRAPAAMKDEPSVNRNITSGFEPTPDPLAKAFNDALRPYHEQIEEMKDKLEQSQYQIQTLEEERADMHAWIDKKGLRADVPPSIAQAMNADPTAAQTLNHHLDRKMAILNHDLHRLQDSISSHLPTATFATTLAQLIPPIEDLSALPAGAPLAFELMIKLGGNLNSHGGDDGWNNEADAASRADFYKQLDDCMLDIVQMRLTGNEVPPWDVKRDVKRLEKTATFLRTKLGLREYFPRSLEMMRRAEGGLVGKAALDADNRR